MLGKSHEVRSLPTSVGFPIPFEAIYVNDEHVWRCLYNRRDTPTCALVPIRSLAVVGVELCFGCLLDQIIEGKGTSAPYFAQRHFQTWLFDDLCCSVTTAADQAYPGLELGQE